MTSTAVILIIAMVVSALLIMKGVWDWYDIEEDNYSWLRRDTGFATQYGHSSKEIRRMVNQYIREERRRNKRGVSNKFRR